MDRDLELVKVRILANHLQSQVNLMITILYSVGISLFVLVLTVAVQKVLSNDYLFGFLIFGIADLEFYGFLRFIVNPAIRKKLTKNFALIDRLLKDIEDGKALGSLIELKKMKKPN